MAACVVAAYWGVWSCEFVNWDDAVHLADNPYFWPPEHRDLARLWRGPYFAEYVPLTYTVWSLEAVLNRWLHPGPGAELDPVIFHGGNLLLHILCALAAWRLFARGLGCARLAAWAGAALFALHPLAVESVAWASDTRTLLAGIFSCLALERYVAFSRLVAESGSRKARIGGYVSVLVLYMLALASKSSASVVPLMAAVLDGVLVGRRHIFRMLPRLLPMAGLAAAALLLAKGEQPTAMLTTAVGLAQRPLVVADALLFYVRKLFWPAGLAADYGRQPAWVLAQSDCWKAPCVLLAIAGAIAWRRPARVWLGTIGVFVAALAPVLGFVPFVYQDISTVADRYTYLALLGPAWALAHLLSSARRPAWAATVAAGLILLGVGTWHQQQFWRNTETLFTRTLAVNPRSVAALVNLGDACRVRHQYKQAASYLDMALAYQQRSAVAHYNLANLWIDTGRIDEAIAEFRLAIALKPEFPKAYNNLGLALASQGRLNDAVALFEQALRLRPVNATAHYNLGETLERLGRLDEALDHDRLAVHYDPLHSDAWNNLGNVQAALHHAAEAEAAYRRALRLDPANYQAHYNLGLLLLAGQHVADARQQFRAALAIQPQSSILRRAVSEAERLR